MFANKVKISGDRFVDRWKMKQLKVLIPKLKRSMRRAEKAGNMKLYKSSRAQLTMMSKAV